LARFDAALTAAPTSVKGVTLSDPAASQALGDADNNVLAVGAAQAFTITGTPTLTANTTNGATFIVGAEVLTSKGQVLAQARIMLGVQPVGQAPPSALTVLLTTRPCLINPAQTGANPTPALFLDDHLASDLGGSLGTLLTLAQRPGATALIDPALVDDLTQMAGGYQVASDNQATPTPGSGQVAAQTALASINNLIAGGHAYRTLANNPDIDAVAALPEASAIATSAADLPDDHPLAALPLAVVVLGESVPPAAQSLVNTLSPALVVTDALQPPATAQTAPGDPPWVALTPFDTLSGLTGPPPDFDGAAAVQPASARLARVIIAAAQGTPTVTLVSDSASADAVSSWLDDGWAPQPLAQVLAGLKPTDFNWATGEAASQASPDLAAQIAHVQSQLSIWSDLGDAPDAANAAASRLLSSALSASWGGDWASAQAWLTAAAASLNAKVGSGDVELRVSPQWHLSANNNRMPITIVNTFGIPVKVRVHFASENPQRLNVPDSDLVTIEPGDSYPMAVTPQAAGNGSIQVTVTLVTSSGTPVGAPQTVQVVTTLAGRLSWIIIIGSGAAFVVLTSLRVRQVRHQRSAAAKG
jgi:hypothetical protein